jgi:hypothetical protein
MRKLLGLGLVGLTGCANFCDTFFKARNVCRDQVASQTVSAPMVSSGAIYGCSQPICSGAIISSVPMTTDVYSSMGCDCAGTVVMSPTCAGEVVSGVPLSSAPVVGPTISPAPIVAGAISPAPMVSGPITTVPAGAAQPVTSSEGKPHPLLNPIRWMREHHQSKQ